MLFPNSIDDKRGNAVANQLLIGNTGFIGRWAKRSVAATFAAAAAVLITACGGGGVAGGPASPNPTGPSTLTLTLTEVTSATVVTTVAPEKPAKVNATFRNSSGAFISGAVVTFATNVDLGSFVPANGTAVTDASGVASVLLYPSTTSGAALVTATTQVPASGTVAAGSVSGTVAYTATAAPAISIALVDPATGAPRTSLISGNPARLTTTLKTSTGTPAAGVVVTFEVDPLLATLSPASGTALTNSSGVASVLIDAASLTATGAGIARVKGQVGTGANTASLSAQIGYSLGAANLSIGQLSIGSPALSAFGTTSVSVTVLVAGVPTNTPFNVNFSSPCASSGRAVLTPSVATIGGTATASYRDNGCAGSDVITASVSGLALSSTATVVVAPPSVGSIQFVTAVPTSISLRGTGGAGRQENSRVSFRVVDVGGNPLGGRAVTFTLNTSVGGITLSNSTATSDPATGLVVTNVQAGTVSTPVRVTATTTSGSQTLVTQSDQLTITTGVPAQDGFSLSISTVNIEGLNVDGVTTQITARLADHFRNPVPDGTVVNFTSEGASVIGSCTTAAGVCSVTFTSQNFRPPNGRVTVLAYAVGEEAFTDLNGNGWFDLSPTSELIDASGRSADLGEAFVDFNENRTRDANEPFIDFNSNGIPDGPDGKFNGVLCDETVAGRSSPGSCSAQKSINVRDSVVVVLSGSTPIRPRLEIFNEVANLANDSIDLEPCVTGTPWLNRPVTTAIRIVDPNGNAMPAGTTVNFTTSNGTITSPVTTFTIGNNGQCVTPGFTPSVLSTGFESFPNFTIACPSLAQGLENSGASLFTIQLESEVTQGPALPLPAFVCSQNLRRSGQLTVTVSSPGALGGARTITSFAFAVND
jgi:hypothetical protein